VVRERTKKEGSTSPAENSLIQETDKILKDCLKNILGGIQKNILSTKQEQTAKKRNNLSKRIISWK
jgi:hypothetical protein